MDEQLTLTIDYLDPEAKEEEEMDKAHLDTLFDFQLVEIPVISKCSRSKYFHKLMVLLETTLVPQKISGEISESRHLVKKLYQKIKTYHRIHRSSLEKEHALVLFSLKARLCYCLKEYDTDAEDDELDKYKMYLCNRKLVRDCDMYTLGRTIKMTFNNFHCTRFCKIFKKHVKRLYLRCAQMTVFQTSNSNLMNDPLFCALDKESNLWHVRKEFMEHCDQTFSAASAEFFLYKRCVEKNLYKEAAQPKLITFDIQLKRKLLQWIYDTLTHNFISPSEEQAQLMIYALSLNPGEKEKFVGEDRFADPSPYNIIQKYRRPKFDALLNLFESDTPLTDLVTQYLKRTDEEWDTKTSDIALISMCVPMLNFVFSRIYPGGPSFQETFLIEKTELLKPTGATRLAILVQEHFKFANNPQKEPVKVPRFVYVMNEYYVLSGHHFYQCKDFLDAYLQWLLLCCTHPIIMGVPAIKINLVSQFVEFFPNLTQDIQRLRNRHERKTTNIKSDLGMPPSYNSLSAQVQSGKHMNSNKYLF
jgi:hypothetical protein